MVMLCMKDGLEATRQKYFLLQKRNFMIEYTHSDSSGRGCVKKRGNISILRSER